MTDLVLAGPLHAASENPLHGFNVSAAIAALALLAAVVGARVATRVGLPALLVFLAGGVAVGQVSDVVTLDDAETVKLIGTAALVLILVEGGLATPWRTISPVIGPSISISVVGLLVSAGATAAASHFLLGIDWHTSLLLGAIVSSTDAAAVFSQLRKLPLPHRLTAILEAESGLNDAPSVILVTAIAATPLAALSVGDLGWSILTELVIGAVAGVALGYVGAFTLRVVALPAAGLYPLAALAFGVLAYAGAALVHGSGFLACYLAAVVIGNSHLPHRAAVLSLSEGMGWLAQITMFVMLGALVEIDQLDEALLPGLVIGLGLLLLARPLSVVLSLTPFRVPWREQAFLSWAGLRGAVPIVLTTIPLAAGMPGAELLFHVVFVLVAFDTLIQGPTLPLVARWLRVADPAEARELEFDSAPLEGLDRHMLGVTVPTGSALCGVRPVDLALPEGAVVSLVVHGKDAAPPSAGTRLAAGDHLVIVADGDLLDDVERAVLEVHQRPVRGRAGRGQTGDGAAAEDAPVAAG